VIVFLGLVAAGLAAIDWFSAWRGRPRVEQVAKPAVMVAFILLAIGIDADPSAARWLVVIGLAFGLAGDIFLLPQVDRFLAGLGAFLLGHGFYVAAFATMDLAFIGIVGGCAAAAVLLLYLGWPIMQRVRGGPFAVPVSAYLAMDGLLGLDRFVLPAPGRRVVVHVLYHLGQAGFVVGLGWG